MQKCYKCCVLIILFTNLRHGSFLSLDNDLWKMKEIVLLLKNLYNCLSFLITYIVTENKSKPSLKQMDNMFYHDMRFEDFK
jgi:hypothetical protein